MGVKYCPESPRQRMISMMYLVLTALLALNVSAEVLSAFIVVNEGLEATNRIFTQKVGQNYAAFDRAMASEPERVRPHHAKAMKVKENTQVLIDFIEHCKYEVISINESISVDEARALFEPDKDGNYEGIRALKKKDQYMASSNYFIGISEDGSAGKAREIKDKIIEYKKLLKSLLDKKGRTATNLDGSKHEPFNIEGTFTTLDGSQKGWEMYNFFHIIISASVPILNKLVAEIRSLESDVVAQLLVGVGAEDFSFNKIEARIIPKSNFVMVGDNFSAEIFVAAYDTFSTLVVDLGSGVDIASGKVLGAVQTLEGVGGLVRYESQARSTGEHKYGGVVKVKMPGGGESHYPFSGEYFVGAPTATVSADAMNVFYIGVDNPVSISVPGVPLDKVRPSISNGTLTAKGGGKYIVRVTGGSESKVSVGAQIGEQVRSMGSSVFRIRKVPDPVPKIAGSRGGDVAKGAIITSPYIIPSLEDFVFDLTFNVVSFDFTMKIGADLLTESTSGNALTTKMVNLIQNARKGDRCFIDKIRAIGPDNIPRDIGSISMRIM